MSTLYDSICQAARLDALVKALYEEAYQVRHGVGLREVIDRTRSKQNNASGLAVKNPDEWGWRFAARLMEAVASAIEAELAEREAERAKPEEVEA